MTASKQAAKREQAVSLYILDISKEGKRKRWREALPAKTAFETARELAKDGFTCKITRIELTRKQLTQLVTSACRSYQLFKLGPEFTTKE